MSMTSLSSVGLLCLMVAFGPGSISPVAAQNGRVEGAKDDSKSRFVGTWRLVSIEATGPASEASLKGYGEKPVGYIVYDPFGGMHAQIMGRDRSRFASDEIEQATVAEAKAALDGYFGYFGTYEVNEKEGFVIHHVEGSVFPNYVGTHQKRFFEFSGDQLILKPPPHYLAGQEETMRLTWQRVR